MSEQDAKKGNAHANMKRGVKHGPLASPKRNPTSPKNKRINPHAISLAPPEAEDCGFLTWYRISPKGEVPSRRNSQSTQVVGNRMLMFGGIDHRSPRNDLYSLNLREISWQKVDATGDLPPPSYSSSSNLIGDKIYLLGGYGEHGMWLDNLHVLDITKMEWSVPSVTGKGPPARAAHASATLDHKIYIFGGNGGNRLYNDLYTLHADGPLIWSKVKHHGSVPSPRAGHTLSAIGKQLFAFGGGDMKRVFNDLHLCDTENNTWSRPSVFGRPPRPRAGHTGTVVGDKLYVCGGGDVSQVFNDIHVLDTQTFTWFTPLTSGMEGAPRVGHSTMYVGQKLFVFGGGGMNELFNDLLLVDITTVASPKQGAPASAMSAPNSPFVGPDTPLEVPALVLEHKLRKRSEKKVLLERNILKEDVAPQLAATQQHLKYQNTMDRLTHLLDRRPDFEDLVKQGVIKQAHVAPALHATQQSLHREQQQSSLSQFLRNRPDKDELVHHNIIPGDGVSPRIHDKMNVLRKQSLGSKLASFLEQRPTPHEVDKHMKGPTHDDGKVEQLSQAIEMREHEIARQLQQLQLDLAERARLAKVGEQPDAKAVYDAIEGFSCTLGDVQKKILRQIEGLGLDLLHREQSHNEEMENFKTLLAGKEDLRRQELEELRKEHTESNAKLSSEIAELKSMISTLVNSN